MGFLKHALIGIALYEAAKYLTKEREMAVQMSIGSDPDAPLAGQILVEVDDPWKNALADETLRAPDA